MIIHHCFQLRAKCPVNAVDDVYDVTITTDRVVKVEDILAEARRIASEPRFQEVITELLACKFRVTVETVGAHMGGDVTTICRVVA